MIAFTKNKKGQVTVEAVLIMVVLVGFVTLLSKTFQSEELLLKLVQGPWKNLDGMIQNGVWGTPQKTIANHPNDHERHASLRTAEAD
jgi:hypothetical protein